MIKNANFEGESVFNWNKSRNKLQCEVHNHNHMCHICTKEQFLTNYKFFTKLPQILHTHKNHNFKSNIGMR